MADARGPLGLLKRLTSGLARKEVMEAPTPPRLRPAEAGGVDQGVPQPRRVPSQDAALYAPRKGQLDDHGRASAPAAADPEDQLEIPAFLRRQAN